MEVPCGEGVAIHTGPEPRAATREGVGEASVGERAGQPLSRESFTTPGADAVWEAEGNTHGRVSASAPRPGAVADPGMHGRALHGNREISGLPRRSTGRVRIGRARSRSR